MKKQKSVILFKTINNGEINYYQPPNEIKKPENEKSTF